jgi:hypothetical protein
MLHFRAALPPSHSGFPAVLCSTPARQSQLKRTDFTKSLEIRDATRQGEKMPLGDGNPELCRGASVLDSWFRSALLAGLILNQLGMSGCQAVERLRVRRPGALLNECVASYLQSM